VLIIVATLGATSNGVPSVAPELIARGFAEPGPLLDEMRAEAARVFEECVRGDVREIKLLQEHLHDGVGQLIYDRTGRRPMILPVVIEV
jgi:ribonuclease J